MNISPAATPQRVHRNIPQLLVNIIMASLMVLIWGRATGKTLGATAPWLAYHCQHMPRSTGAILCKSYSHMMTKVLQEIVEGWTSLGYIEGLHFWIRQRPPEWANVPRDFHHTLGHDRCIFWYTGAVIKLFSLDKNAPSNGDSVDFMMVEEAKLLDYDSVQEAFKTVRGNRQHFGHLACHGGKLIVTDRPRDATGRWVTKYQKMQSDPELLEAIIECQYQISLRQQQLLGGCSEAKAVVLEREIRQLRDELNELRLGPEGDDGEREGSVYVSFASTLDNIHALGVKAIKNLRRDLTDYDYQLSVLNEEGMLVEDCFYASLDELVHGYTNDNELFIDSNPSVRVRDSRFDADIWPDKPLSIFFDHNKAINCLAVGQRQDDGFHLLNCLRVEEPLMALDLVDEFCRYYAHHPTKSVVYYYDNTSRRGDARRAQFLSDDIIRKFREKGWHVKDVYLGQASTHENRYFVLAKIFQQGQPFAFRYNIANCEWWEYAAHQTPTQRRVSEKGTRFGKDKSSEKIDSGIAPSEATHITEAVDGLIMAAMEHESVLNRRFSSMRPMS